MKTINIQEKLSRFSDTWHPHQIAIVDDMQVLLAKIKGEFIWHKHEEEDELFQVIKGNLEMHFRRRISETKEYEEEKWVVIVKEGEIIVVPKNVEHCPITKDGEEVHVLLFEKLSTAHTGNIKHKKTVSNYPKI